MQVEEEMYGGASSRPSLYSFVAQYAKPTQRNKVQAHKK